MNIGQAATNTGVSAKMIRYYESINLIKPCNRTVSGYRTYDESELHSLRFIKRARKLGFSLEQIRDLLSLWQDVDRASSDVKEIALAHAADLNKRIVELIEMRDTLRNLAQACAGDHRPNCPILHGLATSNEGANPHCESDYKN
jgi:MerR family copper efflux transcriptional regulator